MQLLANTTSPWVRIARIAMIEKGLDIEPTIVDPWADDPRLREANAATRVPTLITDDGTPLPESLLIVQWLERERPPPDYPSLLGADALTTLSRAGIALGVIDAAVHTIITRKVTAPVLFDETPVGLRRRRTMAEGMARIEGIAARTPFAGHGIPTLDAICAVVALDYLRFRFADAPWMPAMPTLDTLSRRLRERPSFGKTMPH
ncbi:glutathione S-transferase N-terminal domain-containing protein [Variovorax sp. YR216]|uniref:glutathione S-transferase N-terminal domain-containing protein n=1 Tax=Variovorax sp. YR216 TaxID=1882828 RepID=UPI00089C66A1|nr:glutathione S-transferase N-terminal domain-containing protein [Variovorax sp. YR216]SEB23725.1 glutathione S-transferase [Variovorax sp. YR216]